MGDTCYCYYYYYDYRCVELMYEPQAAKQLDIHGYQIFNDLPSSKDWHLLLMGAVRRKFRKGETILRQGDELQRIFQIIQGDCVVQVTIPSHDNPNAFETVALAKLSDDETFGEIGFLLGDGAKASVVAASDTVSLFIIEADYFKRLFNADARLAGRFFKYLCTVLERRLREHDTEASAAAAAAAAAAADGVFR
jgi:CRP-like cAMP-binding protein